MVRELQHINNTHNLAVLVVHHRQIQIPSLEHLSKGLMDGAASQGVRWLWSHDTDHRAGAWIDTCGNHSQNDVFGGENTRNLIVVLGVFHQNSRGLVVLHQNGSIVHRRLDVAADWNSSVGQNRIESWPIDDILKTLKVLDHVQRLTAAKLFGDTFHCIVELLGALVHSFEFGHGFIVALGDVQRSDNLVVVVDHRQMSKTFGDHQGESIGSQSGDLCTHWVWGHDMLDRGLVGIEIGSNNTECKVLGRENTCQLSGIVHHQNTIFLSHRHELGRFVDGVGRLHDDRIGGLQGHDGPTGAGSRLGLFLGRAKRGHHSDVVLLLEVVFDLLSDLIVFLGLSLAGRLQRIRRRVRQCRLGPSGSSHSAV
ncbi:hypothetical protein OGAPHI_002553 [Ogataea philodendri]|uniref:Uncharacterized protein n=1 Tax=Ogataea philodendri TaxID=1378263 RepID=A0A9P8PAQ5_9ASCO|nr:uncharacterized protein OGAPHI_002553 [Ogataea philodendri]KAH3668798.1 hypothetical protein OGAPHI_002553 [Ogataea philodendri]